MDLFIQPRRETVWKVAVRVGSRVIRWRQAPKRCSFAPFRRLVGPCNGADWEFPDSLWKGNSRNFASRSKGTSGRMWVAEPETRGAAVDLLNAILPYAMAGAFFFWLIAEDREGSSRSR